jgi:adenylate cyclase
MAHPEHLSLEWGEKRPMSVYFSDIAGFTTISEHLPPERLVSLLNDYLTNMTDIVLQHGGIVDKYIGDAVMAFWGAPLADPDHARKAVKCAIAMRKRCDELRPLWFEEYGQLVQARAGVNSGDAVVGNMGSKHKYNYTVMGDMVNLASRLEGANKPYGTYLMISEFALAEIGDMVDVRELDLLIVKGKEKPVRVFEVLDLKGDTDDADLRAVEQFSVGLAKYRDRDFAGAIPAFEAALNHKADDNPSLLYMVRRKGGKPSHRASHERQSDERAEVHRHYLRNAVARRPVCRQRDQRRLVSSRWGCLGLDPQDRRRRAPGGPVLFARRREQRCQPR